MSYLTPAHQVFDSMPERIGTPFLMTFSFVSPLQDLVVHTLAFRVLWISSIHWECVSSQVESPVRLVSYLLLASIRVSLL